MMLTNRKRPTIVAALALGAALLAGCQGKSDPNNVSYASISGDLTPALRSTTERPVDVDRNMSATNDTNFRMMWDDLGRVWYTDHPSRLTPLPIAPTSGKPR